jgi:siderophore synthetase component
VSDPTAAGANAAVLGRLWGALAREPIDGIRRRHRNGPDLVVTLHDGRHLHGPAGAAEPYAHPPDHLTLDGTSHREPGPLLAALNLPGHTGRLRTELDNSVHNLALARAAQPAPDGGPPWLTRAPDLADGEQLVVDGHPLHPCCRTRIGLTTADVRRYAPEHHPTVDLVVARVPADRWHTTGTGLPPGLLLHPWQHRHHEPHLHGYGLTDTGRRVPARPLMSLRTLDTGDGRHVKTAVDVQMTSAVRTVSPAAVHNGPALSAILPGLVPGLTILPEPAAGAVLVDGRPSRSLAMVHRTAPRPRPGEVVVPMAALAAPSPADGRPLLCEAVTRGYPHRPADFLADLVHLLFAPLTTLLHLGVALEAHGQNMLVALHAGRPVRLYYRDFGGVRVSPRILAGHGISCPPLHGDVVDDDPAALRTKLAAAVLSGVVLEVIAVLRREYGLDPDPLWKTVATHLDRSWHDEPLPVKATTAMRLADDPLDDRWARLPNPMAGA